MKAVLLLSLLLCGLGLGAQTPEGKALVALSFDRFDHRPARKILIIGNSRTYYHEMPEMVRQIADSARSPVRLDITTYAWGGATFEENWNSADVQRALGQHWDWIILQPESRAETDESTDQSFMTYGEKLIQAGKNTQSPVALIVNWGYGETLYAGSLPGTRLAHIERLEEAERSLASSAGAQVIDTSYVWEKVHAAEPALPLYEDGNHPTLYGSYLSALMIAGFILSDNIQSPAFTPNGIDQRDAASLRSAVSGYYRS